jgi:cytidylate kinase
MYRAVTLAALEAGVALDDEAALVAAVRNHRYDFEVGPTHVRVFLDGRDVTEAVRSMRVNDHTHYIAASPGVRRLLVERQREIGRRAGHLVTEGRDQGTVVFPEADIKFFLDADVTKRAERRLHELLADGEEVELRDVMENLQQRDRTDAQRSVAPLAVPEDAIRIDTSASSIAEVLDEVVRHMRSAGLVHPDRETLVAGSEDEVGNG